MISQQEIIEAYTSGNAIECERCKKHFDAHSQMCFNDINGITVCDKCFDEELCAMQEYFSNNPISKGQ